MAEHVSRGPDDFTVTVQLASPELRRTLSAIAVAFQEAEAACGPSFAKRQGRPAGRPGSRPPAGNLAAVRLCKALVRGGERMVQAVERVYRETDPLEREAAVEFHRQVGEMRAAELKQGRSATVEALRAVYAQDAQAGRRRGS